MQVVSTRTRCNLHSQPINIRNENHKVLDESPLADSEKIQVRKDRWDIQTGLKKHHKRMQVRAAFPKIAINLFTRVAFLSIFAAAFHVSRMISSIVD